MRLKKTEIIKLICCSILLVAFSACKGGSDGTHNVTNVYNQTSPSATETSLRGGGATGDGGGGQGILCNSTSKIPGMAGKLLVRDIYEATVHSSLVMRSVPEAGATTDEKVSDQALQILVSALRDYFGPATDNLEFGNVAFWKKFNSQIHFLDESTDLELSQDANTAIILPNTCKRVQLAFWQDSVGETNKGTLLVKKNYWDQLDSLNKIALLAHEYFYKQARAAGDVNSDLVRNKIGRLLVKPGSPHGLKPLFDGWVPSDDPLVSLQLPRNRSGYMYCEGHSEEDPQAKLQMYQYQVKEGFRYVLPLVQSELLSLSSLEDNSFLISNSINQTLILTDLMQMATPPEAQSFSLSKYDEASEYDSSVWGAEPSTKWLDMGPRPFIFGGFDEDSTKEIMDYLQDSREMWSRHFKWGKGRIRSALVSPKIQLSELLRLGPPLDLDKTPHIVSTILEHPLHQGRIEFKQSTGDKLVSFNLTCQDYNSRYRKLTYKRMPMEFDEMGKVNPQLEFKMSSNTSTETDLQHELTQVLDDVIKKGIDTHYFDNLQTDQCNNLDTKQYWQHTFVGRMLKNFDCDLQRLQFDLFKENKVTIEVCKADLNRSATPTFDPNESKTVLIPSNWSEENHFLPTNAAVQGIKVKNTCAMMNFEKSGDRFIVHFATPLEESNVPDKPLVIFARRIPPALK